MAPNNKTFYTGIDTWRGLAAFMVCFYHFALYENNFGILFGPENPIKQIGQYGYLGVYIFFVISGFVIPLSMFSGGYTYRKVGKFIAKRSLRIEPPYLATIILMFCVQYYFSRLWGLPFTIDPVRILAHMFYVVPFVPGMEWYNIIFWTLAIEFQFYLVCAVLFPLWTHRHRWVRHLSLLFFLLSAWYITDGRFAPFYAAIFGLGITLFLLRKGFINRFEAVLYIAICALLLFGGNTREIAVGSLCAFGLLLLPDFRFKPGVALGKVSYSLYLTHGMTGGTFLMMTFRGDSPRDPLLFVSALAISVAFASLFYFVVEKPFQGLSRKMKL